MTAEGYTIIYNEVFHDSRLSLQAKGLYCQIISLPDDWQYSKAGLRALCSDGRRAIDTAINELKKYGYLTIEARRKPNGTFYYIYIPKHKKPP